MSSGLLVVRLGQLRWWKGRVRASAWPLEGKGSPWPVGWAVIAREGAPLRRWQAGWLAAGLPGGAACLTCCFFLFFFLFFSFFKMSVCLMTFQQSWKSFLQSCDYLEVSFFMWKALLYFKIDSFVIFFYTIKCNASISFSVLMKKREICFSKTETKISKNEGWNSNCLILKLLFLCLMKFSREQLKNLVEIVTAPGNSVIQIIFALSVCVYVSISSCLG